MTTRLIAAAALALTFAAGPSLACVFTPLVPEEVQEADLIVTGEIANYTRIGRHARFDIRVDKVLKGKAPKKLVVGLNLFTMTAPETLEPGRYFIALRKSADLPAGMNDLPWQVLSPTCTGGFLFPVESPEADKVRGFVKF